METRNYWEENGHVHSVKYENYNSTEEYPRGVISAAAEQHTYGNVPSEDEADYTSGAYNKKGKVSRQDPMSHRIIEKRRRDRMNNCLADLSRLIPPEYLKKGRGRVEKTEIIEMAIRYLKYLQERANGAERQVGEEQYRAGFQDAATESVRFLAEVQGYGSEDGLCAQLATHLQRHSEHISRPQSVRREKPRCQAVSLSETTSSSSSSQGYAMKPSVIAQARRLDQPVESQLYSTGLRTELPEVEPEQTSYPVECERVALTPMATDGETACDLEQHAPLDVRRKKEPTLRAVRKAEHADDYSHSYKFKNSIERRFSKSQDCEAADVTLRLNHPYTKILHKRRRSAKLLPTPSTSTSASVSTEEPNESSPQDTSSESTHNHHYEKRETTQQYVPVFALNSIGKYYVPLSIEYACIARQLGAVDVLDAHAASLASPLHPVTIHVNFQPYINCHLKREPEWNSRPL